MSAKIAPPDEDLDFVRHERSGRVHVIAWEPEDAPEVPGTGIRVWEFLVPIRTTLCGARVFLADGGPGEKWARVSAFDDDALCRGCHRALGEQAWRAFEHPQGHDDRLLT